MAISKTSKVDRIEIVTRDSTWVVKVNYLDSFQEDDDEPVLAERPVVLLEKTTVVDSDGNKSEQDTDTSKQDPLVHKVCNLVWNR